MRILVTLFMRAGHLMASGVLLIAIFMPLFSFAGDLRLECLLTNGNTCDDFKTIQLVCLLGSLVGIIMVFIGGIILRDDLPKNQTGSSQCPRCGSVVDGPGALCFNCAQPGF
jgi:amino acid transporter